MAPDQGTPEFYENSEGYEFVEQYRGYDIHRNRSFRSDRLVAVTEDDLHSRIVFDTENREWEDALGLLKNDIDRYGYHDE